MNFTWQINISSPAEKADYNVLRKCWQAPTGYRNPSILSPQSSNPPCTFLCVGTPLSPLWAMQVLHLMMGVLLLCATCWPMCGWEVMPWVPACTPRHGFFCCCTPTHHPTSLLSAWDGEDTPPELDEDKYEVVQHLVLITVEPSLLTACVSLLGYPARGAVAGHCIFTIQGKYSYCMRES